MSIETKARQFTTAVLLLALLNIGGNATSPPYRPPFDYSGKALPFLQQKLKSGNEQERASAIYALGITHLIQNGDYERDGDRSYELLKRHLGKEKAPLLREQIWGGLYSIITRSPEGRHGLRLFNRDREFWLNTLNDGIDNYGMDYALFLIRELKPSWARQSVLNSLDHPTPRVKISAMRAAAALDLVAAEPKIMGMLDSSDEDGMVEEKATEVLGLIGTKLSLPALRKKREERNRSGRSTDVADYSIDQIRKRSMEKSP